MWKVEVTLLGKRVTPENLKNPRAQTRPQIPRIILAVVK